MYDAYEIATKINQLLKEKRISQKEMLEKCNLNRNTISSMLSRGSMLRADNLAHIADYLDCSIDYLLDRNNSSKIFSGFSSDLEYKFNSLDENDKAEIEYMINYKYQKSQNKKENKNYKTSN